MKARREKAAKTATEARTRAQSGQDATKARTRAQSGKAAKPAAERTRAQSSIEFLQAIGLLLAVFVVLTPVVYVKYSENLNAQLRDDGQLVADTVAGEINTAAGIGTGYRRAFDLPPLLGDSNEYTVTIQPAEQLVYVNWTDSTGASAAISTSQVTMTAPLALGQNIVYNNGGNVEIGGN